MESDASTSSNTPTSSTQAAQTISEREDVYPELGNEIKEATKDLPDNLDPFYLRWKNATGLDAKIHKRFKIKPKQATQQLIEHSPAKKSPSGRAATRKPSTHHKTPRHRTTPYQRTPRHRTPSHVSPSQGPALHLPMGQYPTGQHPIGQHPMGQPLMVNPPIGHFPVGQHPQAMGNPHMWSPSPALPEYRERQLPMHNWYPTYDPQTNQQFQAFQNQHQMSFPLQAAVQIPQSHEPYQGSRVVQGNGPQLPVGTPTTPQQGSNFQHRVGGPQTHLVNQVQSSHPANNVQQINGAQHGSNPHGSNGQPGNQGQQQNQGQESKQKCDAEYGTSANENLDAQD